MIDTEVDLDLDLIFRLRMSYALATLLLANLVMSKTFLGQQSMNLILKRIRLSAFFSYVREEEG